MNSKNLLRYIVLLLAFVTVWQCPAVAASHDFTVVIDAGHGGKDVGAMDNGAVEKDINLGVALKLADMLRKRNKNLKVVMTRDKDVFLSLQERAEIANKAKADLFISIHTNSVDIKNPNRKTIEGASTYTLGLQKDKNNMEVARRENSVIAYEDDYNAKYSGFNPESDESYIIFEMAQKANLAQSVKFAEAVQKQLSSVASRKNRGVKQAGFWVLWATSMPSVLVELDFITNPDVAKYLVSDKGKTKLASAICNATDAYFKTLQSERKNGRQTRKGKDGASRDGISDDGSAEQESVNGVVLASASNAASRRRDSEVAGRRIPQPAASASRRRRNDKAREKSENRVYEVAVIKGERDYVVDVEEVSAGAGKELSEVAGSDKSDKKDKGKKKSKKSKDKKKKQGNKGGKEKENPRIVNGKTVVVSSSVAHPKASSDVAASEQSENLAAESRRIADNGREQKSETKQSRGEKKAERFISSAIAQRGRTAAPVRLEKKKVIYRIQILASEDHLKSNNPRFCGLSPISCTKSDKLYKYTYGESTDRDEINRMLKMVRKMIPDAFVVAEPG